MSTLDLTLPTRSSKWSHRQARRLVLGRLGRIQGGRLLIHDADGTHAAGQGEESIAIHVRSSTFWRRLLFEGPLGAAESWARGEWDSDDLPGLLGFMARNLGATDRLHDGNAWLKRPFRRLRHAFRSNTRRGSRKNIHDHYDLGNDFFALFLDDTLSYSCAVFDPPTATLEEASRAKLDRVCRKLELGPDDHLLEIGTGWGELSIHAARHFGCRVTTTTISAEQAKGARARIEAAGLSDRIEVLEQDYRDLEGRYDKIVSIEMIEAVGHRFYPRFFAKCQELLAPGGQLLLQAITISDQRYERALHDVDFIQRYIFPGSCIPSVTALSQAATRASDLRLFDLEDLTPHYVRTLAAWRSRFLARREELSALGFDERFIRLWDYYFSYCEAGFSERCISSVHLLYTRESCRRGAVARSDLAESSS